MHSLCHLLSHCQLALISSTQHTAAAATSCKTPCAPPPAEGIHSKSAAWSLIVTLLPVLVSIQLRATVSCMCNSGLLSDGHRQTVGKANEPGTAGCQPHSHCAMLVQAIFHIPVEVVTRVYLSGPCQSHTHASKTADIQGLPVGARYRAAVMARVHQSSILL